MKCSIILNNSISEISNLDGYYQELVEKKLSYKIPGSFFSYYGTQYKTIVKIKNDIVYFPTGVLIQILDFLDENTIEYSIQDLRIPPKSNEVFRFIKPQHELRDYQKKCVEICLEKHRGTVDMVTGSGKTRCILELVKRLSLNSLIVVPTKGILYQFYNLLVDAFGKRMVGIIGDGKMQSNCQITIATYQSLDKMSDDFWNDIQVLIIDEAHHSAADTIQDLNKKQFLNIYYRYYFSGTPFRADGTDIVLNGIIGEIIYSYQALDAIKDGYLTKPLFMLCDYYHDAMLTFGDWRAEYKERIILNDSFNNKVMEAAQWALSQNWPTIIFVQEIVHGEKIQKLIPGSVFVNGQKLTQQNKDDLERFNQGKIKCLIGTSILGEGIDLVSAQCGIWAGGGKSEIETIQRIGRLLRKAPDKDKAVIIDFNHIDSKYPAKHGKARKRIYQEYQSQIIDVDGFK